MPCYIRESRLRDAILALSDWRAKAQSQASTHLFPFLSLIQKGVNADDYTQYEEDDDFAFFNKYFIVKGDDEHPYFDPLTRTLRIRTHPHSNVATARKGTFEKSWHAAVSRQSDGIYEWKLEHNFAEIIASRVMTRGGVTTRANVLDIAVWLFRLDAFDDNANGRTLEQQFQDTFPMTQNDYDILFEFIDEPEANIFADTPLSDGDLQRIILSTLSETSAIQIPAQSEVQEVKTALAEDDPILQEVIALIGMGSSGVILRGCPGTGKSWYAWQIALSLTDNDTSKIVRVQFHPSYGYEDFVEGYRPSEKTKSGFDIVPKSFLQAITSAEEAKETGKKFIYIIDEINRGDPARVFGELLTYIEYGWRNVPFTLPYTSEVVSVPDNLYIIATMNPHDRSITQLDMALLRRFDHIDVLPSKEKASEFLAAGGMEADKVNLIVVWFENLQSMLPFGLGHTYFLNIKDLAMLARVWRYRIHPFCQSVLEFDAARLTDVEKSYESLCRRFRGQIQESQE